MGTRHLCCVKYKGEYPVIQYGQWDGYINGTGRDVYKFLKHLFNREVFIKNLEKLTTEFDFEKIISEITGDDKTTLNIDQYETFKSKYPELSRDTGSDIFVHIQDGKARYIDLYGEAFAPIDCYIEFSYVINLDDNTLEIYDGNLFNKPKIVQSFNKLNYGIALLRFRR